ACDVLGLFGEALDPHRALDAVRSGDDAKANTLCRPGHGGRTNNRSSQLRPAASSAAFARSWARALGRDLIGSSGRAGFAISPASPRKRATRSVGNAPTPSQCWIRSVLRVTRAACERSSIGL